MRSEESWLTHTVDQSWLVHPQTSGQQTTCGWNKYYTDRRLLLLKKPDTFLNTGTNGCWRLMSWLFTSTTEVWVFYLMLRFNKIKQNWEKWMSNMWSRALCSFLTVDNHGPAATNSTCGVFEVGWRPLVASCVTLWRPQLMRLTVSLSIKIVQIKLRRAFFLYRFIFVYTVYP